MSLNRVWMPSPNFNVGNNGVRLVVIHSSEGAQTYQSLGNFFSQSSAQASSHVGIDDQVRGTIGEYVRQPNSAWTASNANMVAVQGELCTPSGASDNWSRNTWLAHDTMLRNLADWIIESCDRNNIPKVYLTPAQAQGNGRGICQHRDLGAWGGGHHDCGPNFPIDYVMGLVTGGVTEAEPTEEPEMFYLQFAQGNNDSTIVIPKEYSDGNHRIRFGCRSAVTMRVDTRGMPGTQNLTLGYDPGAQGFAIEKGCAFMVVHVDSPSPPTEPIAVCFSQSS